MQGRTQTNITTYNCGQVKETDDEGSGDVTEFENVTPPEAFIEKPSDVELATNVADATGGGCRNTGGYVQAISEMHPEFRDYGKKVRYSNDYSGIGTGQYDRIVITDTDLDGFVAGAVHRHRFGDEVKILFANQQSGSYDVFREVATREPECPVFVLDHRPDRTASEWAVHVDRGDFDLHVHDHHGDEPVADFPASEYRHRTDWCASQITLDAVYGNDAPAELRRLVDMTAVRDLWQPEHPRFDRMGMFALAADVFDRHSLVDRLAERGLDGIEGDEKVWSALKRLNYERYLRTDWLLTEDGHLHVEDAGEVTVAAASGHPPDSSLFGNLLREQYGVDVAVLSFPDWGDETIVALRASDEKPIAAKVAEAFGGGGHPPAASFSYPVEATEPGERAREVAEVVAEEARSV